MAETIMIQNNMSGNPLPVLILCGCTAILLYLIIMLISEKKTQKKMEKAKIMIEEGHEKALNGAKDDGLYRETKRRKEDVTISEPENREGIVA